MTKRKQHQISDAPNLKRFRSEIQSITKSNRHYTRPAPKLTRKQKRKEAREEKKSRKNAYHHGLPMPSKEEAEKEKAAAIKKAKEEAKLKKVETQKQKKKARKERKKLEEQEEKAERRKIENLYDDKEIKDLEKKLGLNKRKKKDTLPMSFKADGLDYILDAVNTEKLQAMADLQDDADGDDFGLMGEDSDTGESDFAVSDSEHEDEFDDDENLNDSDGSSEPETVSTTNKPSGGIKESEKSTDKSIISEVKQKQKWEELADKIKELAERKKGPKKSVTFADEVVKNTIDNDYDDEEGSEQDDDVNDDEKDYEENQSAEEDNDDDDEEMDFETLERLDDSDDVDEELVVNDNFDDEETDIRKIKMNLVDTDTGDPDLKEDIYGRLRDAKGNVVVDNKPVSGDGAYVPPARRMQMAASGDEKKRFLMERLQKQMKGLVNRASENNMQPISGQIEELYLHNSRADVNETLVGLISDACITPALTPDRLSMELMMLVAILHGNVGSEVGAAFLQHFAKRFGLLLQEKEYGAGKQIDNVVVLMAHLYNFKVVHSVLVFDVLKKLTENFTEKDIELILLLLKNVGFSLRKDNPSELKDYIVKVQAYAASAEAVSLADQSRVRFMLEVIMAIRNNNMRKIPNYDPNHLDHLRKLIRNYIRGGQFGDNQLHITLEDLLNADVKGKWWLVGSAWDGKTQQNRSGGEGSNSSVLGQLEISSKLQELARKQRMNTDIRRNIFFVIMTSEDFLDAFEKLLRLGLKSSQQQEIILVILDCCLQEKKYNPFYSHLLQKFCEHHRTYQMAFQFCLWDRFKEIKSLSDINRHHLAKLLGHLIITKALSLSVLKVISFGTLEKAMVRLLKQLFTDLLLEHQQSDVEAAFTRIAQIDKLKQLHEGLRLFLRHFLVGKKNDNKPQKLLDMVDVADRLLSRGRSHVLL